MCRKLYIAMALCLPFSIVPLAQASPYSSADEPALLKTILSMKHKTIKKSDKKKDILKLRITAIEEQAFSLGSRAGLWWKGGKLQNKLRSNSDVLDQQWRFSALMIEHQRIIPPIITLVKNHTEVRDNILQIIGKRYHIVHPARFALAAPTWRDYMLYDDFSIPDIESVPMNLRPKKDEIEAWKAYVMKGWRAGIDQARSVMADNLYRMLRDFNGMVRYHLLLEMHMVSRPYVESYFATVAGDADSLDVGKDVRTLKIKAGMNINAGSWMALPEIPSALVPAHDGW